MKRWTVMTGALAAGAMLIGAAFAAADGGRGRSHAVCAAPAATGSVSCSSRVVVDAGGTPHATAAPAGYSPQQLRTAYGLSGSSSGQTIAIVDAYDDPQAESDLNTYSQAFGLPACTTANGCFRKVNQTGGSRLPRTNQGWALEISLDIQVAHGICPTCKVLLVEATSNSFANLMAAEDYAAANANVVSNSFGAPEFSGETSNDFHFNRPGVPITVSSGDSGFGVEYPAASRYVTAVGGTTLTLDAAGNRVGETAWSGAGSGCSAFEPKPAWQADAGCAGRSVADVAAVADPATGASVYDSFGYQGQKGWFTVGGTSLAAPVIAAVYALAGNGASTTAGSYPYAHTSGLFDVVSGANGTCTTAYLCTAGPGYDGPTGLGSPNGAGGF